ncbi:MAG: stage III sporulation protein AA [Oscillospiraceae bacterium]|nr:stage III sporulation protein AA [Oscillospiraceae bacterium]
MDIRLGAPRFNQAIESLPARLRDILAALPDSVKASASEVRLRAERPLMLTSPGQNWFVDSFARLHNIPAACVLVTPEEIEEAILAMCAYSVHSHQNEMAKGFISLKGGHRAGICGTAVLQNGRVQAVRNVTSLNLRIARDIHGAADEIVGRAFKDSLCGVLVAGPPASGKTTILRDLARQLAGGRTGRYYRVAVADERGELGAVHEGIPQNDLGAACDILSGYPKGEAIMTAVRTLSPQVIVCDEIGGEEDVSGILDGLRSGVRFVASVHAESIEELLGKRQVARLLSEDAFGMIFLLGGHDRPCKVKETIRTEALRYENGGYTLHRSVLCHDRGADDVEYVGQGEEA